MVDLLVGDPAVTGALRLDTGDEEGLREVFDDDVDDDIAAAAISLLTPDGPVGIPGETVTVTAQRYGTIPHTYVVCLRDKAFPVAPQRRFVAEIDALSAEATTARELRTSHSPFLSRPAELARIIASIQAKS